MNFETYPYSRIINKITQTPKTISEIHSHAGAMGTRNAIDPAEKR
jgi:hypothetical protein